MKDNPKDPENLLCYQTMTKKRTLNGNKTLPKCMAYVMLFIFLTYIFYTLCSIYYSSNPCPQSHLITHHHQHQQQQQEHHHQQITQPAISPSGSPQNPNKTQESTSLHHIFFGIAASAKLWDHRKHYIKQWWRHNETRGVVWLDNYVKKDSCGIEDKLLPLLKISSGTSKFKYNNKRGDRSAIRISRIISEMLRLGLKDVRWFVMGDDDTFFVPDNLVSVLRKYDHEKFYYIGSNSESHLQNIHFSHNMAYGGGGFAISYPLAKALEKMQDRCIQRYPELYGSDDRIQACMAELGVPLTKEPGFHQLDVYGNLFGLLAAHPITPLVSLHHLDVVGPIFPTADRVHALEQLKVPIKLDSAGLMQQSICYDKTRLWTVSVSWGYAVQIFRGIISPREMELPSRTFLNWYKKADHAAFSFNTRPISRNICQMPYVYYLSNIEYNVQTNQTVSEYVHHPLPYPNCDWKLKDPSQIDIVEVHKRPDPYLWEKPPRRNCCRVLATKKKGTMVIDVGACRDGETIEVR